MLQARVDYERRGRDCIPAFFVDSAEIAEMAAQAPW
jgi:hypothetical protein